MELKEAINKIWENKKYETHSPTRVLSHLNEEVAESLKALLKGDEVRAKAELEDAFSCMLIAMHMLDIDPDQAVERQVLRMNDDIAKTMHIFSNRVEIWVASEPRGGWNIWSAEDLAEALKVAQEFNCKVIMEEDVFSLSTTS